MHTGYDNFWMYQNRRPEPLLSLPVSDIFSDAVLTDSYKQVQNGRLSSLMSNYKPPQNNVSSCQNDHHRMTDSQSLWPSSAYSCPSKSSYSNNFHFQGFPTQPSHVRHSSEKNHVSKNLNVNFAQICNKSSNHSNYIHTQSNKTANTQTSRIRVKDIFSLNDNSIQNTVSENSLYHQKKGQFGLIQRVNHERTWDCDTQAEYMDYGKVNLSSSSQHIPTYESRAPEQTSSSNQQQYLQNLEEFCDRNFQFSSDNQFQFSNNGEVPRDSSVDTARNNALSAIRELLSAKNVQEVQSQKPVQKPAYDKFQRSKRVKINPKRNFSELNSLYKSRPFINTESSNAIHPGSLEQSQRLIQDKSNVNVVTNIHQNHLQENFSNINKSSELLNQSSACSELRKWRKSGQSANCNSPSFNHMNSQENSMIKITIPHTGQSTFISFNDADRGKNHTFSLPCLLDFNDNIDSNEIGPSKRKSPTGNLNNTQENEKITLSTLLSDQRSLISHNTSHHANPVCSMSSSTTQRTCDFNVAEQTDRSFRTSIISPPRNSLASNQSLYHKESVVGCENVQNQNDFMLNPNTLSDNSNENPNPVIPSNTSTEAVPLNRTDINVLTIKQELLHARVEVPDAQHNQNILQDEVLNQNIKTEKSPEENIEIHEKKVQLTENPNPSQEGLPIDPDDTENIDFTQTSLEERGFPVKKLGAKSKTMSSALKDAENRIHKPDLPTENSVEEKNSHIDNEGEAGKKDCESEKNYKSQINRDKLDLLIQFLRKDEEINASKAKNRGLKKTCNKRTKETNSNHNRRKLSKTCIVKNRNNSREMVSLVSHKTPRVEMNKSTSKTDFAQEDTNSTDERKTTPPEDRLEGDINVEVSEKQVKPNESLYEVVQAQKDNSLISEPQSAIESKQIQEVSEEISAEKCDNQEEKNLMSTMQALQKLKTHFCMSCDLVSSIDSFWINVVSGELRCLNCFKKMTLKVEENISMSEISGLICDSEAQPAKEGSIGSKNYLKDEVATGDVLKSDCLIQTDDSSESVKCKRIETPNLSVKHKIISKNDGEQSCKFDHKDDALQKKKNLEEPKTLKTEESLEKSIKNNKSKENLVLKCTVPEDGIKLNTTETCDNLKRRSSTKDTEIAEKIRKSENTSPVKSRKKSISSENCSAIKSPTLSHSEPSLNDSVMKSVTKEGNASPKTNHFSKSCKKTDISEDEKGVATDKSQKKIIQKERSNSKDLGSRKVHASEENKKKEIKQAMSWSVKKLDLIENSACDKNHAAEEISKKNTKHDSLNKSKIQNKVPEDSTKVNTTELWDNLKRKTSTKDTEIADKMRKSEENVSPVKSRKKSVSSENSSVTKSLTLSHSDPLDSKDGSSEQKQKTTEQKKQKEKRSEDESARNSSSFHNVSETNKKIESVEHSRKRKNSSEYHGTHKVRIVEEHKKKSVTQVTHVADKSKTNFPKEDKNKMEHDKSNTLDSVEKSRKNRLSKELCEDSGEKPKRETKQDFESLHSDKTKTKSIVKTEKACEKTKTSYSSKHKTNESTDTSRRKSQEDCTSPKHGVSREHSKKPVESPGHMKKKNVPKEELGILKTVEHSKKEIKHSSQENKEKKKTDDKKLSDTVGKIPKITHPGSEGNEVFRSPLSDGHIRKSSETSNLSKEEGIVKMKNTSRKDKPTNTESGVRTQKKKEGSEEGDRKAQKGGHSQNHTKLNTSDIIKTGFDKKQSLLDGRSDKNKQNDNSGSQRRKHIDVEGLFGRKKDTVLKEGRQDTDENGKTQSAELLAKLIKKTKKLSWSLLGEAKKI